MNRLLIPAAALVVGLLVFRHPASAPAAISTVRAPGAPQHSRKGHPSSTAAASRAVVYVAGAVLHPGLYSIAAGARVHDAVLRAGGLRADADAVAVNLAERVSDGEEIAVPRLGEATPRLPSRRHNARKRAAPAQPVDLNAADAAVLATLPGVGQTLADRIVEYRRLNGPFATVDELADVAGMTQRRIDALTPLLTVHDAP